MCGLFGVVAFKNTDVSIINQLAEALASASETRGTDAGGLSYLATTEAGDKFIKIRKNAGAVSKNGVFREPVQSRVIMGHTRQTTQGNASLNFNNHPFKSTIGMFSMAHNGILYNDRTLATSLSLPDTKIETDSYVVVRLLDKFHNGVVNFDTLKDVAERLTGSFNLTFQTEEGLWIVKHNNPLTILKSAELGCYLYASTEDILLTALKKFYGRTLMDVLLHHKGKAYGEFVEVTSGTIMLIKNDGTVEKSTFTPKPDTYYQASFDYSPKVYHGRGSRYQYDDYDDYIRYQATNSKGEVWDNEMQCFVKKALPALTGSIRRIFPYSTVRDKVHVLFKCFNAWPATAQDESYSVILNPNGDYEVIASSSTYSTGYYSRLLGRFVKPDEFSVIHTTKLGDLATPFTVEHFKGVVDFEGYKTTLAEIKLSELPLPELYKMFFTPNDAWKKSHIQADFELHADDKKLLLAMIKAMILLFVEVVDKYALVEQEEIYSELMKIDTLMSFNPVLAYTYMNGVMAWAKDANQPY